MVATRTARRLTSAIDLTSRELRLERGQTLSPEGLQTLGLPGIGDPCVLDGHRAAPVSLLHEGDVDTGLAVTPVEPGRLRLRRRALAKLVFGQPAPAQRTVDERVEEP